MNNWLYYLNEYEFEKVQLNLYLYFFLVIYVLLQEIIESKGILIFNDNIIKFYLYHIVQFFKKDEKTV